MMHPHYEPAKAMLLRTVERHGMTSKQNALEVVQARGYAPDAVTAACDALVATGTLLAVTSKAGFVTLHVG